VVTQKDAHISAARQIAEAFSEESGMTRRPLLVVGGPRFDPAMAGELGVDRVFGRGTTPREVASYLAHTLAPEPQEAAR
jgi:beta-lysine 5,6-aminomutase beta subunit